MDVDGKLDTIPVRLSEEFIRLIKSGELVPGTRMPGYRALAEKYNVGFSTMIAALKILTDKGYIEKHPSRGTFVSNDACKLISTVNIFCPLPSPNMVSEKIGYDLLVDSEFWYGLTANAVEDNFHVTTSYLPDDATVTVLRRQLNMLKNYDAVVFIGPQFSSLKNLIAKNNILGLVVAPHHGGVREKLCVIDYDHTMGYELYSKFCQQSTNKKVGILRQILPSEVDDRDVAKRVDDFKRYLSLRGVPFIEYTIAHESDSKKVKNKLNSLFPVGVDEELGLLICVNTPLLPSLQQLFYQRNWVDSGKICLAGFTGGGFILTIYPQLPYIRVPFAEMGKVASKLLVDAVRNGTQLKDVTVPPVIIAPECM